MLDRIVAEEPGTPAPGSIDVLAMGPPCQGFTGLGASSAAGAGLGRVIALCQRASASYHS